MNEQMFWKFKKEDEKWIPKVIIGDIREIVEKMPDNSIDCIMTSPPYWMQRDYEHAEQIGREETPEEYTREIATIFENLRFKLKKTATIFLNVGYKYLNGELVLIPEMIAMEMRKRGFTLKNKIIWWKPNSMPTPARTRLNNTYEPVLFFIRDEGRKIHYFNLKEISEKPITMDHYNRLLSIHPKQLLGVKIIDPLSMRGKRVGRVVGVRFVSDTPIEVYIKWEDENKEWVLFGDPLKNYSEKVSFACPLCNELMMKWEVRLSFANLGKMVCPSCRKNLCESSQAFPVPMFKDVKEQIKSEVKQIIDLDSEPKKYITKVPKSTKFLNAGMTEISMASPAGRMAIQGEYLTIKRRWDTPQLLIAEYLRYFRKCEKIATKDIDKTLGYKHTAGHWLRRDFGWWGRGGSIPKPSDWKNLKNLLKFNDVYDRLVTEKITVLQTVKPHEDGRNPGDVWRIMLEQYNDAHFAIFPTKLVENSIKVGCPPNGVVLDPFAGSGTVGEIAINLGRKAVLVELLPEYLDLIRKRCHDSIEVVSLL